MLILRLTMMEGRTPDQKRELIRRLSASASERLGVPLADVRMTVQEVPASNWAVAGIPMSDRLESTETGSSDDQG